MSFRVPPAYGTPEETPQDLLTVRRELQRRVSNIASDPGFARSGLRSGGYGAALRDEIGSYQHTMRMIDYRLKPPTGDQWIPPDDLVELRRYTPWALAHWGRH